MIFKAPHLRRVGNAVRELAQVEQALHRPLAVGRMIADDQAAMVVLDRAGEDLAGAGAELADQHDQRPGPGDVRVVVFLGLDLAVGVLDLHHLAVADEQAGEADRLAQRSAAVPADIENDRIDALAAEVVENSPHVVGGALEGGAAAMLGVGVAVEAGQTDHADAVGTAVRLACRRRRSPPAPRCRSGPPFRA